MSLISIILTLIVSGALLWIINNYLPLTDKVLKIINIALTVAVIAWLLKGSGIGA